MAKKKRKKPPFVRRTGKAPISKKQLEAKAAETGLTKLPTMSLVATINTMLGILQDRGLQIRDWDDRSKVVHKLKVIRGNVYILAPHEQPETEAGHGESGEHDTGQ